MRVGLALVILLAGCANAPPPDALANAVATCVADRDRLLSLDIDKLDSVLGPALDDTKSRTPIRQLLVDFAAENGITL